MAAPEAVEIPDATGFNLWPMIVRYGERSSVSAWALLALLKAESGLDPNATRQGHWPDWSAGLAQITVQCAAAYGLGHGYQGDWAVVKAALMDRERSIRIGAQHYAGCLAYVRGVKGEQSEADWLLDGLRVYNGGRSALDNPAWEARWSDNVRRYREAIAWSIATIEESA